MPHVSDCNAALALEAAMAADDELALLEELQYEAAVAIRIGSTANAVTGAEARHAVVGIAPAYRPRGAGESMAQTSGAA